MVIEGGVDFSSKILDIYENIGPTVVCRTVCIYVLRVLQLTCVWAWGFNKDCASAC